METADELDRCIKALSGPLEKAKAVAVSGKEEPNLPDYVKWQFNLVIGEIDRVSSVFPYKIERLRAVVPKDALAEEQQILAIAATRPELLPK